jgi:ribosome biogenesis protein Nip4
VAWAVNISELSVKYRQIYAVNNSNGKHRRNISVSNCGIDGNFFATLGKIPTASFRLENHRYLFKIFFKKLFINSKKT